MYCESVTVVIYCGVEVVRLNYHDNVLWRGGTVKEYCGVEVL
jgi:ribosomal protein S12